MKLWQHLCLNLRSQGEWKCLAHPMASWCMVNWEFTSSPLLKFKHETLARLIRARPNSDMISDNPNVSFGIVDRWLHTRRMALKDDYHKKRNNRLEYTPVQFNYLESPAKIFIIPSKQNRFIRDNIFINTPVRRIAIAMNPNSGFTGSYTENSFCVEQFDLRH